MNFKRGAKVRVKSDYPHLCPKSGDLGKISSDIEIMGGGVPAVRVKFINNFLWWVHPKHLELVK